MSVETERDEIQLTLDKKPQNCKNSCCLGSFLTTRSRTYHDYNDSLSEIPFSSLDTQSKSHEVQTDWLAQGQPVITTKCQIHDEKKLSQSLISEQDINKDKWQE